MKLKINPYIIILIIYIIGSSFSYYFFRDFVNTNFFFASVTFIVGSLAFYIYTQQKVDEKINAAVSILTEVRNAESKIDIIIDNLNRDITSDLPSVLPTNNWRTYSHLFVKDFDTDELQLINAFYNACEIIEDFVNRQNNFFWVTTEERAKTAQHILAEIHDDFQVEARLEGDIHPRAQQKFDDRKAGLTKYYANEAYLYAPQKTLDVLRFQTQNFQKIIPTTCGVKLKKLANLR